MTRSIGRAGTLRVLGLLLLLTGLSLAAAIEWSARRDRRDAVRLSHLPDAVGRASAAYHGARAQATLDSRFTLSGHATWGLLLVLGGAGLIILGRAAHDDESR